MIKDYTYCEELKNGIFKLDNGYVNNDYLINIDDKQKKKYCC
jgi:hypothetical protein